jgi:D-glycero-D-manno-heptose 1,7-bisphosphate phosphatase
MKPIILDRDGVINQESAEFVKTPEEWLPLKGSLIAIARLSQAGYDVIVLTNQSGVARGFVSADMLSQIHVRMIDYIHQAGGKISSIAFCPHGPDDDCECRKPKTGLYSELVQQLGVSFNGVYSVGDSLRDLQAAQDAGALPILVLTGNGKKTAKEIAKDPSLGLSEIPVFKNLLGFSDWLLSQNVEHTNL